VDTTNQTIDWASDDVDADGGAQQPAQRQGQPPPVPAAKQSFNPLTVVSKDGFSISVSVKVVIRVRPDQAPYMVAKIGSVDNLIQHVIHPMIDSSFRNQASSTSAMNFMQDRQEEQGKAEERTRKELEKYHVELVSVLICQIGLPENLMKTQTDRIIADQQQAMYQAQQKAEQERIAKEKTAAQADQQKDLVTAEIGVKVAEQNRQKAILAAEGEGQAIQIRAKGQGEAIRMEQEGKAKGVEAVGLAEATAIQAKGLAAAKAYDEQRKAVTPEGLVAIEVTRAIAEGKIKVTPDFLIQGGGDGGVTGLLSAFLAQRVTNVKSVPPGA
jgi:regulator of protease activity HflC (stomatin/prohibitin superfamily)